MVHLAIHLVLSVKVALATIAFAGTWSRQGPEQSKSSPFAAGYLSGET